MMNVLREAIEHYHAQLVGDTAPEADFFMRSELRKRSLYFGDRPLCTVLRPHFYFKDHWDFLKRETEILLSAFARAHEACLHDADLREQLALQAYEEQLFSIDIGGVIPWTSSRLDSFFSIDHMKLQFVEYNAETPAGMGYGDVLATLFMELEPMKRFQGRYHVEPMMLLENLYEVLMWAWHDWGGQGTPNVVIADWQDVPTLNEHSITRAYLEARGVKTFMVDPRALEYHNGHLWVGNFRVDVIYKRVLISEMIERMGIDNPIVQAVQDRKVLMTNSFSCKLMAKKASFAFVSDERNAHLFDAQQRRVIHEHIPWTRVISDRETVYHGQEVDLLTFINDHRERFVIKPNDEYGGKGVCLGWESTDEQWEDALNHALNEPFVVQERVESIMRDFPTWIGDTNTLDISPRHVDADPYVFYGKTVYGCLTRLSSASLLNVTAGGGSVVPTFLIERKD